MNPKTLSTSKCSIKFLKFQFEKLDSRSVAGNWHTKLTHMGDEGSVTDFYRALFYPTAHNVRRRVK